MIDRFIIKLTSHMILLKASSQNPLQTLIYFIFKGFYRLRITKNGKLIFMRYGLDRLYLSLQAVTPLLVPAEHFPVLPLPWLISLDALGAIAKYH